MPSSSSSSQSIQTFQSVSKLLTPLTESEDGRRRRKKKIMSESGRRTTYGTAVGGGSVVTQSFETEVSKLPPSTSTTTQLIQSNSLHNSSQSLEDDVEFYYFYKVYNTYNIFPSLCIFFLTISLYFSLLSLSFTHSCSMHIFIPLDPLPFSSMDHTNVLLASHANMSKT